MDRWEDGTIPATVGSHDKIPLTPEDTWTDVDGTLYPVKVFVNAIVTEEMRFGNVPIVELRGFKDDVKDTVLTKGFTTDFLDVATIHQLPVVASEQDLAIKPVLVLGLKSTYPRMALPANDKPQAGLKENSGEK